MNKEDLIERIVSSLTPLERNKILRAKYDGADFVMPPGYARGLHQLGLIWRADDGYYLTETGVFVRKRLKHTTPDTKGQPND